MKFGKDEIQKVLFGIIMLIAFVYSYFNMLLGPLKKSEATTRKNLAALGPEISKAKAQIAKVRGIAEGEGKAKATIAQIEMMIPEGSPVAWFPPRVAEFFKARGVDKAATRLNNELPEKTMPAFRRLSWSIDLPKVEFVGFGTALAQLENDEPLVEIAALQIDTNRDDPESQHAVLTVNNLVTK